MTEIDIWIAIFKEDEFIIKDELSRMGSDTNILEMEYSGREVSPDVVSAKMWFNYKTGDVTYVKVYHSKRSDYVMKKGEILSIYKDRFRDYKIQSILEE